MNNSLILFVFSLSLLLGLSGIVKFVFSKYKTSLLEIIQLVYYLCILFLSLHYLLKLNFIHFAPLTHGLLGLMSMSFLLQVILFVTQEWSIKKMKTLLRLPIIGILLGIYLKENILWMLFIVEFASFLIGILNYKKHLFASKILSRAGVYLPLLFLMLYYSKIEFYFAYLVISFMNRSGIINALKVKNIIYQSEKESVST